MALLFAAKPTPCRKPSRSTMRSGPFSPAQSLNAAAEAVADLVREADTESVPRPEFLL